MIYFVLLYILSIQGGPPRNINGAERRELCVAEDRHVALTARSAVNATWRGDGCICWRCGDEAEGPPAATNRRIELARTVESN